MGLVFRNLGGSVLSCDVALADGTAQPVLAEAARRLATAIEASDHLTVHSDDLASCVDAQSGARVMKNGRCPSRIKGGLGNLVQRLGLTEVRVNS